MEIVVKTFVLFIFLLGNVVFGQELGINNVDPNQYPVWRYPYPELTELMKVEGKTSLLIFSYGSLMDINSARETLSDESLSTRRPALAYGLKRVFDRDVKPSPDSKWCTPLNAQARGMLNVVSSPHKDFINGIVMDLMLADVSRILSREVGYDLIPVLVKEWNESGKEPGVFQVAYTFHAPQGSVYTNPNLLPRPGYYELTRNAPGEFGPVYSKMWFQTTFLSDGKTPISWWERKVQRGDPETRRLCQ